MSQLSSELHGRVAICRLDRPEAHNALSPELMEELATELERLDSDSGVGCIIVTGNDEAFASGPDVELLADPSMLETLARSSEAFWTRVRSCGTPLIAAVRGWALGSGCELALACDLLIADEKATFGLPETTLGMVPSGGATQYLARIAGRHRAMELILTGRRFYVPEAREMSLINQVSKQGNCLQDALVVAGTIAERSPLVTRLAKQAIAASDGLTLEQGLELERELSKRAGLSSDRAEAVRAFLEKRPPNFDGR